MVPKPIQFLGVENVSPTKSLKLTWLSPVEDERGKKLKRLTGYHIYRTGEELGNKDGFTLVATIPDTTTAVLEKKVEESIKNGAPVQRVKLTEVERQVSYVDTVDEGKVYFYRIVPYNHSWFEGRAPSLVKVLYAESGSTFQIVPNLNNKKDIEDSTLVDGSSGVSDLGTISIGGDGGAGGIGFFTP
jgi:hypothetical protein